MLDEDWCPIVQVHGLFQDIKGVAGMGDAPRCGLLMELYGVSLYDVLHKSQHALVELQRGRPLPPFTNESKRTVARNVASACRYLHDLGIMHRDLKDCNVLVDPGNKYRAKLTDFGASAQACVLPVAAMLTLRGAGTSKNTRQVFQQETAGTTHTLAPEALLAQDVADESVAQADKELDYRAIDVYAYGILLCALWDHDEEDQRRHIKRYIKAGGDLERQMALGCKHHVRDRDAHPPHGLRPAIPPMLERHPKYPDVAHDPVHGMPPLFVELMEDCWHFDPDERPSFSGICKRLKRELRHEASLGTPLAAAASLPASERLRVMLNVSYSPKIAWGQPECVFTLAARVENHGTAVNLTDGVAGDVITHTFPFLACAGESVSLHLSHSLYAGDTPRPEDTWVGEADCADLLTNIQAGEAPQELPERKMVLRPHWSAPVALTQNAAASGAAVALFVKISRTPAPGAADSRPKARNLGVVQLALQSQSGVLSRSNSAKMPNRLPRPLREERHWQDCQVFISYRDSETGVTGSNFAFRLQEALETAGYSVFCYGSLLKVPQNRWLSPFTDGVQVCKAFIPICSPEYGDLDQAPWSAAELLHAVREQKRAPEGWPRIIPIRHHGAYPPSAEINVIAGLEEFDCVPDQDEYCKTPEARRMKLDDVWQLVIARLEDADVKP